jgi:uncharacterized protein YhbP (UPF0306 family)
MKLVAIGFLGHFDVYVDMTKEDAIARYNRENPGYTVESGNLTVFELEVKNGKFTAYSLWVD